MFQKKNRPKIRPPRTTLDFIFESISIAAMLYGLVLVFQNWTSLPNTIPTHFNASGIADGWGPKGMIWVLPAISVVMVPLILLLCRFPWLSNTPIKITEQNAVIQYGLIVRLLSVLACVVSMLFLVLVYDTITIAKGGTSLLGWWLVPIFVGATIVPILWYFIAAMMNR